MQIADLEKFRAIKNLIIDMDGVLYRGLEPLPGGREFLSYLRSEGVPFILATNNSTLTPRQYVAKLEAMDIQITEDHVLTSGQATALYLAQIASPSARVYAIGEEGLISALEEQGFVLTGQDVVFVVVGMDRQLTYEKLKIASLAIRAGATFIGTNPDTTLPTEEGLLPGNGASLAALEAATGVSPVVIGKPQPTLLRLAMERMKATPDITAIIGDRLETDILGGKNLGLTTILVLTGISHGDELDTSAYQPDLVFDDIGRFHEAWRGERSRRTSC